MKHLLVLLFAWSASAETLPVMLSKTARVRSETIALKSLDGKHQYSFLYSLNPLLPANSFVDVELRQGARVLASKTLHAGDNDLYTQFRLSQPGPVSVVVRAAKTAGNYTLQVNQWPLSTALKSVPSHRWQDAMPIYARQDGVRLRATMPNTFRCRE